jgi:hypothetical protein
MIITLVLQLPVSKEWYVLKELMKLVVSDHVQLDITVLHHKTLVSFAHLDTTALGEEILILSNVLEVLSTCILARRTVLSVQ